MVEHERMEDGDGEGAASEEEEEEDRPFDCSLCGAAFEHEEQLLCHEQRHPRVGYKRMKAKVENSGVNKCMKCGRCFTQAGNLRRHVLNVHLSKAQVGVRRNGRSSEGVLAPKHLKCLECGRTFSRPSQLASHQGMHQRLNAVRKKGFLDGPSSHLRKATLLQGRKRRSKMSIQMARKKKALGAKLQTPKMKIKVQSEESSGRKGEVHDTIERVVSEVHDTIERVVKSEENIAEPAAESEASVTKQEAESMAPVKKKKAQGEASLAKKKVQNGALVAKGETQSEPKSTGKGGGKKVINGVYDPVTRPYECDLCPKAFGKMSLLTRHRKTHSGERPFQCHLCPKTYTRKFSLQMHVNTAHPAPAL